MKQKPHKYAPAIGSVLKKLITRLPYGWGIPSISTFPKPKILLPENLSIYTSTKTIKKIIAQIFKIFEFFSLIKKKQFIIRKKRINLMKPKFRYIPDVISTEIKELSIRYKFKIIKNKSGLKS